MPETIPPDSKNRRKKFFEIIGWILLVLICLSPVLLFSPFIVADYKREMSLREDTTPITRETQAYLCETFELSAWDRRCRPWRKVYSHHFYGLLVGQFVRQPDVTYEMVTEMIGDYEISCYYFDESGQEIGDKICHYDFSENNDLPFDLSFDENGYVDGYLYPYWWMG